MKILELTLSNYRGYAEYASFRFAPSFTVVAGINGGGKTALLEGISLLCSRFLPDISPARGGYRTIKPSEVHVGATVAELSMKVNCADIWLEYKLTYHKERRSRKTRTTNLPPALKQEIKKRYGDPKRADYAVPIVVYYTTDRASYRLPRKLPTAVPRGQAAAYLGALFNSTVNYRDFMARYRSAIVVERTERRNDPNYLGDPPIKAISNALAAFLGGFENLRVQEKPLRLLVDKDGETLDLSQLSDGERSLLAIICDLGRRLALANPLCDNPLHGAGVVLIDELELHLHPKWQRQIVHKLTETFPHCQFIATTHSPQVIGEVKHEHIHIISDGEVYSPTHSFGVDSSRVLEEIMDVRRRTTEVDDLLSKISREIDQERYENVRELLDQLVIQLGERDPEVTRTRTLLDLMERRK